MASLEKKRLRLELGTSEFKRIKGNYQKKRIYCIFRIQLWQPYYVFSDDNLGYVKLYKKIQQVLGSFFVLLIRIINVSCPKVESFFLFRNLESLEEYFLLSLPFLKYTQQESVTCFMWNV